MLLNLKTFFFFFYIFLGTLIATAQKVLNEMSGMKLLKFQNVLGDVPCQPGSDGDPPRGCSAGGRRRGGEYKTWILSCLCCARGLKLYNLTLQSK